MGQGELGREKAGRGGARSQGRADLDTVELELGVVLAQRTTLCSSLPHVQVLVSDMAAQAAHEGRAEEEGVQGGQAAAEHATAAAVCERAKRPHLAEVDHFTLEKPH